MARVVRCCAVALAVFSFTTVCRAETLDCWLLTGNALERARQQGLCLDTFARNTTEATPSHGGKISGSKDRARHATGADALRAVPPPPSADPAPAQADVAEAPAAPPVRRDPVANALSAVQQEFERFAHDVERDLGLVGRALLQGGASGTPSHSPPSGR